MLVIKIYEKNCNINFLQKLRKSRKIKNTFKKLDIYNYNRKMELIYLHEMGNISKVYC